VTQEPVSSLDVVPTALAAAGVSASPEWKLDGLNLLPWLSGGSTAPKRGPLYWKFGLNQTAIREGDMKLVRVGQEGGLFNVRLDLGEARDRTSARSIVAKTLEQAWQAWDKENIKLKPARDNEASH
jgi:arylsulfatase A-like enzyme